MTVEGAPHLRDEHLPVFDCANRCGKHGKRFLAPMAHVRMMAAAQPFLSRRDLEDRQPAATRRRSKRSQDIYDEGWRLGPQGGRALPRRLQGIAAARRRATSKKDERRRRRRPTRATPTRDAAARSEPARIEAPRRRDGAASLPKKRGGFTQEARVGGHKVFLRTGEYEDGALGEIFIDMHKEGAAFRSLMNCFAISVSMGLQYGVPLQTLRRPVHVHALRAAGHRRGASEHASSRRRSSTTCSACSASST